MSESKNVSPFFFVKSQCRKRKVLQRDRNDSAKTDCGYETGSRSTSAENLSTPHENMYQGLGLADSLGWLALEMARCAGNSEPTHKCKRPSSAPASKDSLSSNSSLNDALTELSEKSNQDPQHHQISTNDPMMESDSATPKTPNNNPLQSSSACDIRFLEISSGSPNAAGYVNQSDQAEILENSAEDPRQEVEHNLCVGEIILEEDNFWSDKTQNEAQEFAEKLINYFKRPEDYLICVEVNPGSIIIRFALKPRDGNHNAAQAAIHRKFANLYEQGGIPDFSENGTFYKVSKLQLAQETIKTKVAFLAETPDSENISTEFKEFVKEKVKEHFENDVDLLNIEVIENMDAHRTFRDNSLGISVINGGEHFD